MVKQDDRRAATTAAIRAGARELFSTAGFEKTSIDQIAERARVTKGAFYHYFDSKERIFEEVLEMVQSELTARVVQAAAKASTPAKAIRLGLRQFLRDCTDPQFRQIVLVDGPAVLGWKRWRDIDARYFGALLRRSIAALRGSDRLSKRDDALVQLLLGACTEAALACGTASDGSDATRHLLDGLYTLIAGVEASPP